jgi:hypothetical protein
MKITGYTIPGSRNGQSFTVPEPYAPYFTDQDTDQIADALRRETGQEPKWQTVRGAVIRLAKQRRNAPNERSAIAGGTA